MPGRTAPPPAKATRTGAGAKAAAPQHAADHQDDDAAGLVALHRVRFVEWAPSPVTAAAARPDGAVLAAAREDGEIELWDACAWACLAVRLLVMCVCTWSFHVVRHSVNARRAGCAGRKGGKVAKKGLQP